MSRAPTIPSEPEPEAEPARTVFVQLARCPRCGGADLYTYGSRKLPDNTVRRNTSCRTCAYRFFVIVG